MFRVGVTRGLSFGLRPDATVPRMSCSEASLCTARSTAMAFRIRVLMLRHCFLSRDARDGELWPPRLIVRLIVMSAVCGRVLVVCHKSIGMVSDPSKPFEYEKRVRGKDCRPCRAIHSPHHQHKQNL